MLEQLKNLQLLWLKRKIIEWLQMNWNWMQRKPTFTSVNTTMKISFAWEYVAIWSLTKCYMVCQYLIPLEDLFEKSQLSSILIAANQTDDIFEILSEQFDEIFNDFQTVSFYVEPSSTILTSQKIYSKKTSYKTIADVFNKVHNFKSDATADKNSCDYFKVSCAWLFQVELSYFFGISLPRTLFLYQFWKT